MKPTTCSNCTRRTESPWASLATTLEALAVLAFVLVLVFLFHGEPSVWDVAVAIAKGQCK